ncbi:MAG: YraN family protein [Clostridia bacterium]|nr:YraN family protein [Clostridia bacterium]
MNKVGVSGEVQAKEYLIKKKYKILACNYTTKLGEIDIIAKYKNVVVFVEVKSRNSVKYGLPREAVTTHKQVKIKQVATQYLLSNQLLDSNVRFDVIDILDGELTHIENAF